MAVAPRKRGAALGEDVPHLFLSHSSKDRDLVWQLAEDLNLCGVDVWFDAWELRVGDDLHDRIADAVDKSRFVAVVVTKHFNESKWIRGEVNQALSREKSGDRTIVLPLLADNVSVPTTLAAKKFLDVSRDYFGSLLHLAGLVHDVPPDAIEGGVRGRRPQSVLDCVVVLEHAGWNSRHVVGTNTLAEIERAGGDRDGDVVHFSPEQIIRQPGISDSLRRLMASLLPPGERMDARSAADLRTTDVESRSARYSTRPMKQGSS